MRLCTWTATICMGILLGFPVMALSEEEAKGKEQAAQEQLDADAETKGETAGDAQSTEDAAKADGESEAVAQTATSEEEGGTGGEITKPASGLKTGHHPSATQSVVLGAHVGVLVPQLFNELGSWPVFGLELGYILPFNPGSFNRPLQVSLGFGYSAPGANGTGVDPNLGDEGGSYEWDLQQRMLTVDLFGLWRFLPLGQFLSAHALVGPRLYLMESVMDAAGEGNDFGQNRETKTQIGMVVGGGVDLAVGPGTLTGELKFSISGLDQEITGKTNTGAFSVNLGYRFYL